MHGVFTEIHRDTLSGKRTLLKSQIKKRIQSPPLEDLGGQKPQSQSEKHINAPRFHKDSQIFLLY